MALFNRKKGDASAPEEGTTPADSGAFDFDAISRDLDAQNGASSFDSLLAGPATNAPQTGALATDDSAFDIPKHDPLGLSIPSANTPTALGTPGISSPAPSPDAVINAPLGTPASPSTGVAPFESAPVVVPSPSGVAPRGKKPLPLVPLLGALGLLAVAGGGAMFLLNSNKEVPDSDATMPPISTRVSSTAPAVVPAQGVPPTGLRSASPGIAPQTLPTTPITGVQPQATSSVPVSVGQSPAVTGGIDGDLAAKLKALWKEGADAKHRGDNAGARKAWQSALLLRPGHPGFQDAINKLPR